MSVIEGSNRITVRLTDSELDQIHAAGRRLAKKSPRLAYMLLRPKGQPKTSSIIRALALGHDEKED